MEDEEESSKPKPKRETSARVPFVQRRFEDDGALGRWRSFVHWIRVRVAKQKSETTVVMPRVSSELKGAGVLAFSFVGPDREPFFLTGLDAWRRRHAFFSGSVTSTDVFFARKGFDHETPLSDVIWNVAAQTASREFFEETQGSVKFNVAKEMLPKRNYIDIAQVLSSGKFSAAVVDEHSKSSFILFVKEIPFDARACSKLKPTKSSEIQALEWCSLPRILKLLRFNQIRPSCVDLLEVVIQLMFRLPTT